MDIFFLTNTTIRDKHIIVFFSRENGFIRANMHTTVLRYLINMDYVRHGKIQGREL